MKRVLLPILCLLMFGCHANQPVRPTQISSTRSPMLRMKTIEMPISRKELNAALNRPAPANDIRMVLVFRGVPGMSETEGPPPEYRFFDIKAESAYDLLGLKNGDILVAAHDFIVYNPTNFPTYVAKLIELPEGFIEIRRGGEPYVLKYRMQD